MDFDIKFNLEIDRTIDDTNDKYEILEILDLINDGHVSIRCGF